MGFITELLVNYLKLLSEGIESALVIADTLVQNNIGPIGCCRVIAEYRLKY